MNICIRFFNFFPDDSAIADELLRVVGVKLQQFSGKWHCYLYQDFDDFNPVFADKVSISSNGVEAGVQIIEARRNYN